jgi:capsular polysaccharide transport system permease protein
MREMITRYGRHNIGFLWLFVEPALFTLGITALWNIAIHRHVPGISVTAFALTGYSSVLLWRNCSGRCLNAIEPNMSLMYHRNVKILDVFLARLILEVAGATASFLSLSLVFYFFGLVPLPANIATILAGWALLALYGMSLGILVGALSALTELIERVWHIVTYLLFPLSGAAFLVQWLPPAAQKFVLWIPMVHATEMIRLGFFGNVFTPHFDVFFLVTAVLVQSLLAIFLLGIAAKRAIPD